IRIRKVQQPAVRVALGEPVALPCVFALQPAPARGPNEPPDPPRVKWSKVRSAAGQRQDAPVLVAKDNAVKVVRAYEGRVALPGYARDRRNATLLLRAARASDAGLYRCEVVAGIDDEQDLLPLEVTGVVFHYRPAGARYALTFAAAQRACRDNSAVVASPRHLQAAFEDGYDNCDAGWLADQSVRYPITLSRPGCYGDRESLPGVRSYGRREPGERYDVYCFASELQGKRGGQRGAAARASLCRGDAHGLRSTAGSLAWRAGLDRCDPGWLADGSVRYPIRAPRAKCGGQAPGVRTLYQFPNRTGFPAAAARFDAYCYRASEEVTHQGHEDAVTEEHEDLGTSGEAPQAATVSVLAWPREDESLNVVERGLARSPPPPQPPDPSPSLSPSLSLLSSGAAAAATAAPKQSSAPGLNGRHFQLQPQEPAGTVPPVPTPALGTVGNAVEVPGAPHAQSPPGARLLSNELQEPGEEQGEAAAMPQPRSAPSPARPPAPSLAEPTAPRRQGPATMATPSLQPPVPRDVPRWSPRVAPRDPEAPASSATPLTLLSPTPPPLPSPTPSPSASGARGDAPRPPATEDFSGDTLSREAGGSVPPSALLLAETLAPLPSPLPRVTVTGSLERQRKAVPVLHPPFPSAAPQAPGGQSPMGAEPGHSGEGDAAAPSVPPVRDVPSPASPHQDSHQDGVTGSPPAGSSATLLAADRSVLEPTATLASVPMVPPTSPGATDGAISEDVSIAEDAPVTENTPGTKDAPITTDAPNTEDAPGTEDAPSTTDAANTEDVHSTKDAPSTEDAPGAEDAPGTEDAPTEGVEQDELPALPSSVAAPPVATRSAPRPGLQRVGPSTEPLPAAPRGSPLLEGGSGSAEEPEEPELTAWTGGSNSSLAAEPCANNPCLHGGTSHAAGAVCSCSCAPGFTGENCEIDIDDCLSSPCRNGGTCIDEVDAFVCLCLPSYGGSRCERGGRRGRGARGPGMWDPPDMWPSSPSGPADTEGCEHNWHKFQGHCYRYFAHRRSWEDAERDCRRRAGHLASIHSREEHAFINGFGHENTWIGLNDRIVEQDFQWTDNTVLQYENWRENQPDNFFAGGEDCVVLVSHEIGKWNDVPCNYNLPYICKKGTVLCGPPPEVAHAFPVGKRRESYSVHASVRYQCEEGFAQRHVPTIKCHSNGKWDRPKILCTKPRRSHRARRHRRHRHSHPHHQHHQHEPRKERRKRRRRPRLDGMREGHYF
ncbi:NCAN protein, partial [Crypturellus undulatus]|nr:NCAN protein [Crypturellus undulatus]